MWSLANSHALRARRFRFRDRAKPVAEVGTDRSGSRLQTRPFWTENRAGSTSQMYQRVMSVQKLGRLGSVALSWLDNKSPLTATR